MATPAEIRQQLVAALRSDLIGPSWDDRDRHQSRDQKRAWLDHSQLTFSPDLLHKRIGNAIETVAHSHQQIVGQ